MSKRANSMGQVYRDSFNLFSGISSFDNEGGRVSVDIINHANYDPFDTRDYDSGLDLSLEYDRDLMDEADRIYNDSTDAESISIPGAGDL